MSDTHPTASVVITGTSRGEISPMIYGGMIEHFARTVYPGIWDAERDIPRADTKAAIEAMGVRALRYPGGCFSDNYHWRDGIGPKEKRPLVTDSFWSTVTERIGGFGTTSTFASTPEGVGKIIGPPEPNLLGTDEFLQYCLDIDAEPFLVINIGTGTVEEAADWVRYCNVDRISPRPVTYWSIGNETFGAHELGHSTPDVYGRRVVEYATAMRAVDPSIKIVAVGMLASDDGGEMFDAGDNPLGAYDPKVWNQSFLAECADHVDLVSVHWYFPGMIERPLMGVDDLRQLSTAPQLLEEMLATTVRMVDDLIGPERKVGLSFDEWNRMVQFDDHIQTNHSLGNVAFFAGCYNAMLAYADRLPIAVQSHLVNCLAPIQTDDSRLFVTAAYLVSQLYGRYAHGTSLAVEVDGPEIEIAPLANLDGAMFAGPAVKNGRTAKLITAAASRDGDRTSIFIVNADPDADHEVRIVGWQGAIARTHWVTGPGLDAQNDLDDPDVLGLRESRLTVDGDELIVTVPRAGVLVVTD